MCGAQHLNAYIILVAIQKWSHCACYMSIVHIDLLCIYQYDAMKYCSLKLFSPIIVILFISFPPQILSWSNAWESLRRVALTSLLVLMHRLWYLLSFFSQTTLHCELLLFDPEIYELFLFWSKMVRPVLSNQR